MKRWLFLTAVILLAGNLFAITRYVSRAGSNTPPYDTPEKATDSLALAFNVAQPYDTVRVAAGTFYCDTAIIRFKTGMVLIGASKDSTTILPTANMNTFFFFHIADSTQVKNLHFNGLGGKGALYRSDNAPISILVENNHFEKLCFPFVTASAIDDPSFRSFTSNTFESCDHGIDITTGSGLIQGNVFNRISNFAIRFDFGSPYVTIANNSFYNPSFRSIYGYVSDSGRVVNNLIEQAGDLIFDGGPITNNILKDIPGTAIWLSNIQVRVANNILLNNRNDFILPNGLTFDRVHHNDIWRTNGTSPDTIPLNNYNFDPMFVDSVNWELQFASPAIDTGDISILDLDSTRSDLGIWGGPWGKITPYPDLPPRTPLNFAGLVQPDSSVSLSWRPNTEADLSNYLLFRDTSPGVPTDSAHLWATIPKTDSVFTDGKLTESRFYKLVAIDTSGHPSAPTSEVSLTPTGVDDEPKGNLPKQFELYQNYPNPFNAATTISFFVPSGKSGSGEFAIYNLRGEKVRVLAAGLFNAGRYIFTWDGKDDGGNNLPSGIYFYSLKISDQRLTKKMVLVK